MRKRRKPKVDLSQHNKCPVEGCQGALVHHTKLRGWQCTGCKFAFTESELANSNFHSGMGSEPGGFNPPLSKKASFVLRDRIDRFVAKLNPRLRLTSQSASRSTAESVFNQGQSPQQPPQPDPQSS